MNKIVVVLFGIMLLTTAMFYEFNNNTLVIETRSDDQINIDVYGAVQKPGVYKIKKGMTALNAINSLNELIIPTRFADKSKLNNLLIIDEDTEIFVPYLLGYEPVKPKVCINKITLEELKQQNIVSSKISESIYNYIFNHPNIETIDELINISGVGQVTLGKINEKARIC